MKFRKDESEEFELGFYTTDEIENMISTNEIYDGMTLATCRLLEESLPSRRRGLKSFIRFEPSVTL
ncbi:MAG: hypothetical protein L0Y77_13160 [Chlorobi bacterium]|nr:hypothetical protein [Chlorobiota bacterium]